MDKERMAELAKQFEEQEANSFQSLETENSKTLQNQNNSIANPKDFNKVLEGVQKKILEEASKKISSKDIVEKHAESLKEMADKAIQVDAEKASLIVAQQDADNKVEKQKIKNQLIELNAEAKRIAREQKQLNKEQKADHKARNKQAKWDIYKEKLQKMNYSYVPNPFVLSMLLFFDGVRSFFDGLGTVSTAIVKALKWFILCGAILIVLFSIPVTREWIINFLGGH